jgi:hypothetical protein
MRRRTVVITLGFMIFGIAWYLFRPELAFIDKPVKEEFPRGTQVEATSQGTSPVVLFSGRFHDVAHEGEGVATVYQLPTGERVLRFTDFKTLNGPALYVYLFAAGDAHDNATVERAGFVSLGQLKGNLGEQNYNIPADLDLTQYRAVSIWCRRFSVNFATAPLTPSKS